MVGAGGFVGSILRFGVGGLTYRLFPAATLPYGTLVVNVVGCLAITYECSDWRNSLFWWIQSVFVAPSHRAKGVFTAMYSHVKGLASSKPGVCGIRLYVEKDNTTAQRTYKKLGMIETHYRIMEEEFK